MSSGRLKIEVLTSGAIVNPFEILDAVNKGVVDCGPVVDALRHRQASGRRPVQRAARRLGQRPRPDGPARLVHARRRARALRRVLPEDAQGRRDAVPVRAGRAGGFGWFKKPITSVAEFTKLRFRISSGLPSDVLKDMGGVPMNLAGAGTDPGRRARHRSTASSGSTRPTTCRSGCRTSSSSTRSRACIRRSTSPT